MKQSVLVCESETELNEFYANLSLKYDFVMDEKPPKKVRIVIFLIYANPYLLNVVLVFGQHKGLLHFNCISKKFVY